MKRLAIITTHPIQYNVPLFRLIAEKSNISIKVFYTWQQAEGEIYDPGFKHIRKWDIPLLDGYCYEFVKNVATKPGSHHFRGIINPDIIDTVDTFFPDAILVFGWSFSSHLKILRHYKGKIPVYFRGDSTLIDEQNGFSVKKIFRRFFLKWVYSFVDFAFYTGIKNKEYFLVHGLAEQQLIFGPHSIENERFTITEEISVKSKYLKNSLNIPEEACVFLFAGKFHSKKDPITLIKAIKEFDESKFHLVLAGNGALEEEMKILTKNNHNIHFLPFQNQSQMPALYHLCDIFILPSKGPEETWGLAINEAMAAGKTIIASDKVGAAYDLIINGYNGYVFKNNDIADLKNKIELVLRANISEMGNNSKELLKNHNLLYLSNVIESAIINRQS
jgi:glycosyltransferase involved in cell wall biosynthesis